jgi:FAD/FMN-containing dehydrogenase
VLWALSPDSFVRAEVLAAHDAAVTAALGWFERHGAVHAQVGRFYRLAERMDPGSRELLARVKRALDPEGRMNPGSLGL